MVVLLLLLDVGAAVVVVVVGRGGRMGAEGGVGAAVLSTASRVLGASLMLGVPSSAVPVAAAAAVVAAASGPVDKAGMRKAVGTKPFV